MDFDKVVDAVYIAVYKDIKISRETVEKAIEKALQEIDREENMDNKKIKLESGVNVDELAEKTAKNIRKNLKYGINIDKLDTEEYVSSPKLDSVYGVSHTLVHKLMPKFDIEDNNKLLEDNNLLYNSIALSKKSNKNLYLKITSEKDIKQLDIMDFSLLTLFGSLLEKNPEKKAYTLQEIARELIPLDDNVKIRSDELYREIIQSCRRLNLTECYLNFEQDQKTKTAIEEKRGSVTEIVGALFNNYIVGIRLPNGDKTFGVNLCNQSKFYYYFKEARAIRSYPKSLFAISSKNSMTVDFIKIYLLLRYRVINFISLILSGKSKKTDFEISVNEIYNQFKNEDEELSNGKKQRIREKAEKILNEWTSTGLLIDWEALRKNKRINQYKLYIEDKNGFEELKKYAKRYQEIKSVTKKSN